MRIAVVTPMFPTSARPYHGSAILQTVLALQKSADVEVFCPLATFPRWHPMTRYAPADLSYSPEGVRATYFEYPALPVVSRPWNGSNCARRLLPYLRDARADLILAYYLQPEGYAAVMVGEKLGLPVIVGSRGSDLHDIRDPFTRRAARLTVRRASFVLTVSEDLRRRAMDLGGVPEKVRTIHNGCDTSVFRPADRAAARAELGVASDAQLVLFVGWLAELKGVRELWTAALGLLSDHPRLQVVFIGEGLLEPELRRRLAHGELSGHAQLLGPRRSEEIARWLAASDLLCLPSHKEGCPNVVLEALSCGRPVVGSNVGGIPELLDESSGVLVPPGNALALREALSKSLRRSWDDVAIAKSFGRSWEDVARETMEVCSAISMKSQRVEHREVKH